MGIDGMTFGDYIENYNPSNLRVGTYGIEYYHEGENWWYYLATDGTYIEEQANSIITSEGPGYKLLYPPSV